MTVQPVQIIEAYLDTVQDSYQRINFVDRLDSIRSLVSNEGFPEGTEEAIEAFLDISASDRPVAIQRLRIRNQVLDWANGVNDVDAILGLITDLQNVADNKSGSTDPTEPVE